MDNKKLLTAFRKLGDKLNDKDFDLQAWKAAAVSLFSRSFGPLDPKVIALEDLKIDYGSWALRDAPSTYDPKESCKRRGREIVQSAIEEIDVFGISNQPAVHQLLQEVYTEDEVKQIVELADDGSKSSELKKVLDKAGKEKSVQLILKLLSAESKS